jgi:hypothetical protein
VIGLTRYSLLGEYEIRLELDNLLAHGLDLLLLNLEDPVPVLRVGDLNVGLTLSLLVLERAIEEDDARVLDPAPHLGVRHVLVDHHSVEHDRVLDLSSWDLLDFGVSLDVDRLGSVLVARDGADSLEGELAHHVGPAGDKLGSDGRLDEREHLRLVRRVDRDGDGFDDDERLLESALEGGDDDDGVDVALEVRECLCEDLSSCRTTKPRSDIMSSRLMKLNAPRMMTLVVPSPTSSSCVRESSIMLLAAGCATSISRKMAFPSFVNLRPLVSSSDHMVVARCSQNTAHGCSAERERGISKNPSMSCHRQHHPSSSSRPELSTYDPRSS